MSKVQAWQAHNLLDLLCKSQELHVYAFFLPPLPVQATALLACVDHRVKWSPPGYVQSSHRVGDVVCLAASRFAGTVRRTALGLAIAVPRFWNLECHAHAPTVPRPGLILCSCTCRPQPRPRTPQRKVKERRLANRAVCCAMRRHAESRSCTSKPYR
jgi:hypothetical protein